MIKLNEDVDKVYNQRFTESEFVTILLSYLYKNGIRNITEEELAKKLFPYYKEKTYSEVFSDVAKARYEQAVDISDGMYREKYFSGNIKWTSNNPVNLMLCYDAFNNEILSDYELRLPQDILDLVAQIAREFGVRSKVETKNLNIYGYNPNQGYGLVSGLKRRDVYEHILLTDGEVEKIIDSDFEPHIYYQDPTERCKFQVYDSAISRFITLANASFAISQGIVNNDLKKISVYTKIVELEKLQLISELAREIHEDKTLLVSEKPYVRKLTL